MSLCGAVISTMRELVYSRRPGAAQCFRRGGPWRGLAVLRGGSSSRPAACPQFVHLATVHSQHLLAANRSARCTNCGHAAGRPGDTPENRRSAPWSTTPKTLRCARRPTVHHSRILLIDCHRTMTSRAGRGPLSALDVRIVRSRPLATTSSTTSRLTRQRRPWPRGPAAHALAVSPRLAGKPDWKPTARSCTPWWSAWGLGDGCNSRLVTGEEKRVDAGACARSYLPCDEDSYGYVTLERFTLTSR